MTETAATYRELRRSRSDRMLAGVCGGLGQYFDVNPVFYRIAFVILTLLGGAGVLIYGACLLVIPVEGETESITSDILRNHRQRPVALVGLALVAIAGIALLSHVSFHVHSGAFWVVVLAGGAIILGSQRRDHAPAAATRTTVTVPAAAAPPQPAKTRRVRHPILLTIGGLFLAAVIAVLAFGLSYAHLGDGVGNRTYGPTSAAELHDYRLGVGNLQVDLSKLRLAAPATIKARLGIGQLRITVPPGVRVRVHGRAAWGDVRLLGHDENGHDVDTLVGSTTPQLTIDAHVDAGQVDVIRAVR